MISVKNMVRYFYIATIVLAASVSLQAMSKEAKSAEKSVEVLSAPPTPTARLVSANPQAMAKEAAPGKKPIVVASAPVTPRVYADEKAEDKNESVYSSEEIAAIQQLFALGLKCLLAGQHDVADKWFEAAAAKGGVRVLFFYEQAMLKLITLAQQDDKTAGACLDWCCQYYLQKCDDYFRERGFTLKGAKGFMPKVIAYYEKLAKDGYYNAQVLLYRILGFRGHGVEVRLAEACKWKCEAAETQAVFAYEARLRARQAAQ
jgi:hypothetical protein